MFRDFNPTAPKRFFALAALVFFGTTAGWSANYKILHVFKSGNSVPSSGLAVDAHGNAYGTTAEGCASSGGTVYEMSPTTGYHLLYHFSCYDSGGNGPQGNLAIDSAGNLYGATTYGGNTSGACGSSRRTCGTVFELSPPSNGTGLWTETVLYAFCGTNCDEVNPESGVIMDSQGNLYGTASDVVFELSPPVSGNGAWTETVLYTFCSEKNCTDGEYPVGGLIFDEGGNLYGTTTAGGTSGGGTVFELSPGANGWIEGVLYSFCSQPSCPDGLQPRSGLIFDASGNLYGTTSAGGHSASGCAYNGFSGCGIVFALTPSVSGSWAETIVHAFSGNDGATPLAGVVLDPEGSVYGTTYQGGTGPSPNCDDVDCGTVFKLTPENNGQWRASVFRFADDLTGSNPTTPVSLDSAGNVYGTTTVGGGLEGGGVLFRITH